MPGVGTPTSFAPPAKEESWAGTDGEDGGRGGMEGGRRYGELAPAAPLLMEVAMGWACAYRTDEMLGEDLWEGDL